MVLYIYYSIYLVVTSTGKKHQLKLKYERVLKVLFPTKMLSKTNCDFWTFVHIWGNGKLVLCLNSNGRIGEM